MIPRIANLGYALVYAALVLRSLSLGALGPGKKSVLTALAVAWAVAGVAALRGRRWGHWLSLGFLGIATWGALTMLAQGLGLYPGVETRSEDAGDAVLFGAAGALAFLAVLVSLALQIRGSAPAPRAEDQ